MIYFELNMAIPAERIGHIMYSSFVAKKQPQSEAKPTITPTQPNPLVDRLKFALSQIDVRIFRRRIRTLACGYSNDFYHKTQQPNRLTCLIMKELPLILQFRKPAAYVHTA